MMTDFTDDAESASGLTASKLLSELLAMDNIRKRNPFTPTNGNILKSVLCDASNELLEGSPWVAMTKYRSALDMVSLESGYPNPISAPFDSNPLIIKYALCWALIKCGEYPQIASAVEQLKELISIGQDTILPALHYALAKAYRLLFRFNNAKDSLFQGKCALLNIDDFKVFYWPGTLRVIPETVRLQLEENMETLERECGSYHSSDARCKYKKCLEISEHIVPSENIYFSDPKFTPFLVLTCEEKCKVEFHVACWKDMKKESDGIDKPKDMLGQLCPTIDCFSSTKEPSVVVEVKLVDKGDSEGTAKVWTLPNGPIRKPIAVTPKKKAKPEKTEKFDDKVVSPMDKNKLKKKEKKISPELSPPGAPGQDIKTYSIPIEPPFEVQLAPHIELLDKLRRFQFGFKSTDIMNPREAHFGNPHVRELANRGIFLDSVAPRDPEAVKKEFILSMFYELIKKDGVQDIKDINAVKDKMLDKIEGIDANNITDIWQLLLESRRFCAVGDKVGTSEDIPRMYKAAEAEIIESTSQVVLGSVVRPRTRSHPEEAHVPNTFQLFPPVHAVPRPEIPVLNIDSPINNFANEPVSSWGQRPGFKQTHHPQQGIITSDPTYNIADKNSNSDVNEFSAFAADNILNANLPIKNIPVRNELKNSIHSINSEDALNDNLDVRRTENYSQRTPFDNPIAMNALKNGDVGDSVGGIPFSDKIDLSAICHYYMGPRWVNEDHTMLQKEREIEELTRTVRNYRHVEQNLMRSQMEFTQTLEKKQTEMEGLKLTIKKYECLLEEKNKHLEDTANRNKSLEQELLQGQMRLLDMWKQHEDFIIKTINQKYNERLTIVNQLKKFMFESDRKKIEDDMRILEGSRSFQEISRRTEEFYKLAKERIRIKVPHFYLPEHIVDPNIGANIIEQALEFIKQGNNVERPVVLPFDGFYQQPPATAYHTQPLNRSQAPPLMSIAVSRPVSIDSPNRSQAGLSQSSSRSSTPQPQPQLQLVLQPQQQPPQPPQPAQPPLQSQPPPAALSSMEAAVSQFGSRPAAVDPIKVFAGAGTKPKAPVPVAAPQIVQPKILPPSKLPSSEKASVPFPIDEPIRRKFSNFSELTEEMSFLFPAVARQDLSKALRQIKSGRPNKTLNGMSQQVIADKLETLLASREFKRPSHVGLEKFSAAAWGAAPNTSNNWKGSDENECHICVEPMTEKYFLVCKHAFHEHCINEWAKRNAECPLCRQYFKTDKNYPELRSATN